MKYSNVSAVAAQMKRRAEKQRRKERHMEREIKLALLGDKAAQERLTERGELLPCPFCGGKADLRRTNGGYGQNPVTIMESWEVRCGKGCISTNDFKSKIYQDNTGLLKIEKDGAKDARRFWNTRAPLLSESELRKLEEEA